MDRVIRIIVDDSQARRGSEEIERGLDSIETSANSVTDSLKELAGQLAGFAAGALTIGAAVDAWVQYDEATRNAANLTGAALDDIKTMANESAIAFGRFGADAAAALSIVGSKSPALLDNAAALKEVTEQALELADAATATGDAMSDADAAGAITAGLNQWGVAAADAAKEADRFGNVLAAGAMYGSASISAMTESMKASGTVAASAGISIESYTAILQTMAGKQLEGAEAGTALRNVINTLLTKGKEFEDFGISAASVNPKIVGIETALKNLSPILEKDTALTKIFGAENIVAAKILGENAAAVADMTAKVSGTNTAYEQAQAGLATFSKQFDITLNLLRSAAAIGIDSLIGPLKDDIESIAAGALASFNESLKNSIVLIQQFAAYIEPIRNEIGELVKSILTTDFTGLLPVIGVGGALWAGMIAAPVVIGAVSTAMTAATAVLTGAIPAWYTLNTAMWGTSLSATAATGALGKLKIAGGVLFAAWAGWEIGKWAYEQFGAVRIAGAYAVEGVLKAFEYLKFGAESALNFVVRAFGDAISNIQESFAALISGIASGLEYIPGMGEAAAAINGVATSFKNASIETDNWGRSQDELNAELNANLGAITANVESLLEHEMAANDVSKADKKVTEETKKLEQASNGAAAGMSGLALESDKTTKKLTEAERAAKQAAEAVTQMWAALGKETATLGMDDAQKRAYDLAEQMRAAGESESAVAAKTAEYEAQIRLNQEFEKQLKIEEDLEKNHNERIKKANEFIKDQEEQVKLAGMATDAERERYKALKDITPELKEQAAAAYDLAQRAEQSAEAWSKAKDGLSDLANSFASAVSSSGNLGDAIGSMAGKLSGSGDLINNLIQSGRLGAGASGFLSSIPGGGNTVASGLGGIAALIGGDKKAGFGGIATAGATALMSAFPATAPFASMLAPIIGSVVGGLLGGGGRDKVGVGISGALVGSQVTGGQFNDTNGARSFTLDQSRRKGTVGRYGHDEAIALEQAIEDFTDNLQTQIKDLGEFFGQDLLEEFNKNFNMAFDFEAKTPEELQAKVTEFFQNATNQAFQVAGESLDVSALSGAKLALYDLWNEAGFAGDALPALVAGLSTLQNSFKLLGIPTENISASAIEAAGGLEKFNAGLAFFGDQFLSESEKIDFANTQLTEAFAGLGMEIPATRDDFKNLYLELQRTGGQSLETAANLTDLLPAIDGYYDRMENGTQSLTDTAGEFENEMSRIREIAYKEDADRVAAWQKVLDERAEALAREAAILDELRKKYAEWQSQLVGGIGATEFFANALEQSGINSSVAAQYLSQLPFEEAQAAAAKFGIDLETAMTIAGGAVEILKQREQELAELRQSTADFQREMAEGYLGQKTAAEQFADSLQGVGITSKQAAQWLAGADFETLQNGARLMGMELPAALQLSGEAVRILSEREAELANQSDVTAPALTGAGDGLEQLGESANQAVFDFQAAADSIRGNLDTFANTALSGLESAIDAEKAAAESQLQAKESVIESSLASELSAIESAHTQRMAALENERAAVQRSLATSQAAANSLRNALSGIRVESERAQRLSRQAAQTQLATWAAGAGLPQQSELESALAAVTGDSQQYFGSFEDYVRDTVKTASSIGELSRRAENQVSIEQQTLDALTIQTDLETERYNESKTIAETRHNEMLEDARRDYELQVLALEQTMADAERQLNAILNINNSTLTVAEAVNGVQAALSSYQSAIQAGIDVSKAGPTAADIARQIAEYTAASGPVMDNGQLAQAVTMTPMYSAPIPAFADGGDHSGGLRLVGENGPELEVTGPSRIIPNNQLNGLVDVAAIVAELKALRAIVERGNYAVAKNTGKTAKILETWDGDGMPETRVLA